MKKYKYTLGIDPSGAFKEGKGTTGWCLLDNSNNEVLCVDTIAAKNFDSYHEYWDAHLKLLYKMITVYGEDIAISIEDYILYKSHAMAQVNSQLETVQLIGIIKHFCYINSAKYYMRPAVAVKARWSDDILVHKNIITKLNKHYIVPGNPTKVLCDHERDAIRHAVHFNTFENNTGGTQ